MEYAVDAGRCQGHGQCYLFAPNVYTADESGYNAARGQTVAVDPQHEEEAQHGALSCPERAIDVR